MNRPYLSLGELPPTLRVFPLAGCLLLPRCELPLNIFEPRYLAMIDAALAGDRLVGMIQPVDEQAADAAPELCKIGCAGRIVRFAETGDGRYLISLEGVCRFRIGREKKHEALFRMFEVSFEEFEADLRSTADEQPADRTSVLRALRDYADRNSVGVDWSAIAKTSDETLINALSMMSPFGPKLKQALLEASGLRARAEMLVAFAEIELSGDGSGRAPLH